MTPVDPIVETCPTKDCIRFQDGYMYQLVQGAIYQTQFKPPKDIITKFVCLYTTGIMELKAGYAWNGVSGPTVQRNTNRRGGAFHDGVYRLIRYGLMDYMPLETVREMGDELLKEIWIADGMWPWLASFEVKMVQKFGLSSARPSSEPKVMTSP